MYGGGYESRRDAAPFESSSYRGDKNRLDRGRESRYGAPLASAGDRRGAPLGYPPLDPYLAVAGEYARGGFNPLARPGSGYPASPSGGGYPRRGADLNGGGLRLSSTDLSHELRQSDYARGAVGAADPYAMLARNGPYGMGVAAAMRNAVPPYPGMHAPLGLNSAAGMEAFYRGVGGVPPMHHPLGYPYAMGSR